MYIKKLKLGTRDTVRRDLRPMEKNGILNIDKSRWGQGRSHIITINDESELIWIQNNLSNVEKEIDRMVTPLENI